MRNWLRGKGVGLGVFLAVAGLVAGGLGWVTRAALRLEREQLQFRAEANTWLALWRLDSRIFTDLSREANLPFHEFRLALLPQEKPQDGPDGLTLVEMIPTGARDDLPWVRRRLLVLRKEDWPRPQAFVTSWRRSLGLENVKGPPPPPAADLGPLPPELARDTTLHQMLAQAAAQTTQPALTPPEEPTQLAQQPQAQRNAFTNAAQGQQPLAPQGGGRDASLRMSRAQMEINQQAYPNQAPKPPDNNSTTGPRPVLTARGPLLPTWLGTEADRQLAATRLVQVGERPACQVTLLDWPELRRLLAEEIRDLLPHARLEAVREGAPLNPDRTMTALPVALEPGPLASAEAGVGLNPLRVGLVLAWSAAAVALLAVALGGWSLLNLSERRIRFVSAVTHELRTPLTTLRLYLDMLATGMVRDEARKSEYIQTLNLEADRLNRLVGNVLDFSRLESQRPRLERAPVVVADLLNQLQETWQGRCHNAGKELVVVSDLPADWGLVTDEKLVAQILGNLIDNACKYSQGAEDPRVWVRARAGARGGLVLEVEDRGRGVPHRERHLIFRPFRRGRGDQAPAGGVGLGLALAKQWARLLGGRLSLDAAAGEVGACFRLELPRPSAP